MLALLHKKLTTYINSNLFALTKLFYVTWRQLSRFSNYRLILSIIVYEILSATLFLFVSWSNQFLWRWHRTISHGLFFSPSPFASFKIIVRGNFGCIYNCRGSHLIIDVFVFKGERIIIYDYSWVGLKRGKGRG